MAPWDGQRVPSPRPSWADAFPALAGQNHEGWGRGTHFGSPHGCRGRAWAWLKSPSAERPTQFVENRVHRWSPLSQTPLRGLPPADVLSCPEGQSQHLFYGNKGEMQCQGPWMPPSHVEVASGICREQCQPPSVLGTWRFPFPACRSGVTLFYRHHGLSPGAMEGDGGGKLVTNMRISNVDIFQPSPASTLPACCSRGCSRVLGVQAGKGHATSPPQPLSATISHSSVGPQGSAVSPGQEGCLGSQTPGMVGLVPPTSWQGHASCPKTRDTHHVPKPGTPLSWP